MRSGSFLFLLVGMLFKGHDGFRLSRYLVGTTNLNFPSLLLTLRYEYRLFKYVGNRSSNAMAESFNAKIKLFRANLRGVADRKFFLFRIAKLYAYPQ